ncbi:hypothetical protein N0V82_001739 [Gnomoniopsis sp. IMI 355080]|nr:hypothetical protein N0V82_001739 [Gnomoniopsis sp. IMI 355080]
MAGKTAAEAAAAQDPRLKAMLMELGSARFDEFPMEDGEGGKHGRDSRIHSHPPSLTAGAHGVIPKIPLKSAWAKAMQRGDFDDDDAAKVSGMDSMANGQLARIRRNQAAAATAFSYTNDNHESNLRRDRNGYVPPRATVGNLGKRQVPSPIHVGDAPIDIARTLAGPAPDRRPRPTREPSLPKSMFGHGRFAGGPSSQPRGRAQPAAAKPGGGQNAQSAQSATQSHLHVVLPDGAAIILQLESRLGAAMFPNPSQRYRGTVYLISGSQPSKDLILLAVDDENIPEIRYTISQYDTYMSVSSTGLMLKFDNSKNGFNFYGVDFKSAANLDSFVQILRKLVERQKQPSQRSVPTSPINDARKAHDTAPSATKVELPWPAFVVSDKDVKPAATRRPEVAAMLEKRTEALAQENETRKDVTARRAAELQVQREEAAEDMAAITKPEKLESIDPSVFRPHPSIATITKVQSVEAFNVNVLHVPALANVSFMADKHDDLKPIQTVSTLAQQIEGPPSLHPDLINDIIEWAWDTATYMQHSVPEQFGFDTIRTVIGAACAAVIGRTSPSFRKLSPGEQKKFIEDHAQKQVEGGFLAKLTRNEPVAAEYENTDVGPTRSSQQIHKVLTNAELQVDASSELSGPVYGIEELMNMRTAAVAIDLGMLSSIARLSPKTSISQPKVGFVRVPLEAQVQQAAAASSDWLYATRSLHRSGIVTNMCDRKKRAPAQEVSSKVEALADFLSPASGQNAGSPTAGLSDSIHNKGHLHLTGAFGKNSAYHEDLEELVTKSTDKGNAFDHKVVKATEGISRLSLN